MRALLLYSLWTKHVRGMLKSSSAWAVASGTPVSMVTKHSGYYLSSISSLPYLHTAFSTGCLVKPAFDRESDIRLPGLRSLKTFILGSQILCKLWDSPAGLDLDPHFSLKTLECRRAGMMLSPEERMSQKRDLSTQPASQHPVLPHPPGCFLITPD